MRFDGNRSLRNLKFYFEIKIFSQYKVSVLVGGGLTPLVGTNTPLGMVIFQDGYLSKELISTSKMVSLWLNQICGTVLNEIIDFFHF